MNYKYSLTLLGLILIVLGFIMLDGGIVLIWIGSNFLILGFAHWRGLHGIFGKRPNGTLQFCHRVLFFPLLTYTAVVWHLLRLFSREPAYSVVTEYLTVGRRLLPSELRDKFENYIDLTAEFSEPQAIRLIQPYFSLPILDGAAPVPEQLQQAIAHLRPGRTFVHCAQGHGRTGLLALAVLLASGEAHNIDDGLRMLTMARPKIGLNKEQYKCIRSYAEQLRGMRK